MEEGPLSMRKDGNVSMGIHPTAVIHPAAEIGSDVSIGPYTVIGEAAVIGDRCELGAHVIIDKWTELGPDCRVSPGAVLGCQAQDLKFEGGKSSVKIGANNLIREFVTVHRSNHEGGATVIGDNNFFMAYSHVGHDCVIGDNTTITNYAGLSGHVKVEDMAILSGYVAVHQFVSIGTLALVSGCSRVVKDVPPYVIAEGNPVRIRGLNSVGLQRNGVSPGARESLKRAYKIIFRSGLNTTQALKEAEGSLEPVPEVKRFIDFIKNSSRGISK
jgi:UDP-N-acetylglucosamine acyltransferase